MLYEHVSGSQTLWSYCCKLSIPKWNNWCRERNLFFVIFFTINRPGRLLLRSFNGALITSLTGERSNTRSSYAINLSPRQIKHVTIPQRPSTSYRPISNKYEYYKIGRGGWRCWLPRLPDLTPHTFSSGNTGRSWIIKRNCRQELKSRRESRMVLLVYEEP